MVQLGWLGQSPNQDAVSVARAAETGQLQATAAQKIAKTIWPGSQLSQLAGLAGRRTCRLAINAQNVTKWSGWRRDRLSQAANQGPVSVARVAETELLQLYSARRYRTVRLGQPATEPAGRPAGLSSCGHYCTKRYQTLRTAWLAEQNAKQSRRASSASQPSKLADQTTSQGGGARGGASDQPGRLKPSLRKTLPNGLAALAQQSNQPGLCLHRACGRNATAMYASHYYTKRYGTAGCQDPEKSQKVLLDISGLELAR